MLLMVVAVLGGAATLVGGGIVLASRKQKQLSSPGKKQLQLGDGQEGDFIERGLYQLKVDDIVQREARDYLVEGLVEYDEAGHGWRGARLVDGDDEVWLIVGLARSSARAIQWMTLAPHLRVETFPGEIMVADGKEYRFSKRGHATTKPSGDVGGLGGGISHDGASHRCRWWSYETMNDVLLVEQWGADYRVLVGQVIRESDIEMMPGS